MKGKSTHSTEEVTREYQGVALRFIMISCRHNVTYPDAAFDLSFL
jgi:hypothetical protein